ncbi:MAG TPA: response regulator [Blastocatellia bacterium]|nr:response regulator [Blastocatellia bacterium]
MEPEPSKVNILLVDDDERNLIALETILQGDDRNLVRAASGDEALQYLLHNDVAVILMDVRMPGINGLETAELIRGRKQSRDIPIIFLTAYDSVDNNGRARGYALGAVDYLIKPLDPEALKSKVAVFVELRKKTIQVQEQAALLHEKNIQLENANSERLGKLVELGQQLAAERAPEPLLRLFCDGAREIVRARFAAVSIAEPDGQIVHHFHHTDFEMDPAPSFKAFCETELLRPISASNRTALAGCVAGVGQRQAVQSSRTQMGPMLAAPVFLPGRTVGWLYLVDKVGGEDFSEADQQMAMTLASQVAVAYENARLYAEIERHAADLVLEVRERKQAQEEKEKLLLSEKAARLEAERAQKLSAELLVREKDARAEAEAANRLKDDFLATVSHELRTPLNAMLGWAVLLRDQRLDKDSAGRAVDAIERNARTLSRIVGDILDASRIITGKLSLDLRPVELIPVIEAATDVLSPVAEGKRVGLRLSLPPAGGLIVLGDSDRLRQIVWNLVSNAIKFTPSGGEIDVVLESTSTHSVLTVKDTGQGIGPEFLPYVFDRFRQADSSITRAQGGLGLGLAIVQHLVELHGGAVSADSPGRGRGATFTVTIPLATADRVETELWNTGFLPTHMAAEGIIARPLIDLGGLRVLVVEDEEDTRDLIAAVIMEHGADVKSAASSEEALSIIDQWTPNLLLSDIAMAGEDGYELIRKIRLLPSERGGQMPAVAITACAGVEDRRRALAAGFASHVAKPLDQSELIALAARLTGRAPANGIIHGTPGLKKEAV